MRVLSLSVSHRNYIMCKILSRSASSTTLSIPCGRPGRTWSTPMPRTSWTRWKTTATGTSPRSPPAPPPPPWSCRRRSRERSSLPAFPPPRGRWGYKVWAAYPPVIKTYEEDDGCVASLSLSGAEAAAVTAMPNWVLCLEAKRLSRCDFWQRPSWPCVMVRDFEDAASEKGGWERLGVIPGEDPIYCTEAVHSRTQYTEAVHSRSSGVRLKGK